MRGFTMPSGKIKWFNAKKGYGFITDDESKKDIFLHVSALEESKLRVLKEEQTIIYDIKETEPNQYSVQDDEKESFGDTIKTPQEEIYVVQKNYLSQKTPDELKEINNQNIIQKVQSRLNELFKYKKIE